MSKGMTVNELMASCKEQIALGNGNKHILISDDDEGNGFHTLFYSFSNDSDVLDMALGLEHDSHAKDEIVVLG